MKQKEKEGQRRLDRKRRDEFRAVLATEHEAGRLTHRTKWAEVAGGFNPNPNHSPNPSQVDALPSATSAVAYLHQVAALRVRVRVT